MGVNIFLYIVYNICQVVYCRYICVYFKIINLLMYLINYYLFLQVVEILVVVNLEIVFELVVGSIEFVSQLSIGSVEIILQLEKRNLFLEVLCEVGFLEFQNIQRQGFLSIFQNYELTFSFFFFQESNFGVSFIKIKIVNLEDIRKRKYFVKFGKYICNFCGRGCVKLSVLEKYFRVYIGERLFFCLDCGFVFKIKSNLYKYCKFRLYVLKVKLGRKVKQWFSQEEIDIDDVDEYDDEGFNDSQFSIDILDREEIFFILNEVE